MIRSNLLFALVLTVGCRAIHEEKSSDTAGHNLEDSAQTDTAENTDDTGVVDTDTASEDTAVEDSGDTTSCNYELFVLAASDEAKAVGYEDGEWACFTTRPTLQPPIGTATTSTSTTGIAFGMTLGAPTDGITIDWVSASLVYVDDNGVDWGSVLSRESDERFSALGGQLLAEDGASYELEVGTPEPTNVFIGSYDSPLTIVENEHGRYVWIDLSIDISGLNIQSGDSLSFVLDNAIAWHTDTIPMVWTTDDPSIEQFEPMHYDFE